MSRDVYSGHYLVVLDGFSVVVRCAVLRQFFATYGIFEELATDRGLTYIDYETLPSDQIQAPARVDHAQGGKGEGTGQEGRHQQCEEIMRFLKKFTPAHTLMTKHFRIIAIVSIIASGTGSAGAEARSNSISPCVSKSHSRCPESRARPTAKLRAAIILTSKLLQTLDILFFQKRF